MEEREQIRSAFKRLDYVLSEDQAEAFFIYYKLLIEWNQKMNLTAITEFQEVLLKHFIDSAAICRVMELTEVNTVIDVGTGAGFPGIPLKILYPDLQITLLDSLNKRVQFLDTVIKELKLEKISAVHGRAEDLARKPEYREAYDLCVSRAVANLSTLSEYCLPFVKTGGMFVSYKAGEVEGEIQQAERALSILQGKEVRLLKIMLPDSELYRSFVQIRKSGKLDEKYPRKAGLPSKKPL